MTAVHRRLFLFAPQQILPSAKSSHKTKLGSKFFMRRLSSRNSGHKAKTMTR